MDLRHLAALAETHLNDLQADMEAGSRHLDHLQHDVETIRERLLRTQHEQAQRVGALLSQIDDVRSCVRQERDTLRELRRDVRELGRLKAAAVK